MDQEMARLMESKFGGCPQFRHIDARPGVVPNMDPSNVTVGDDSKERKFNMNAMSKFVDDLKEHLGQEKLVLQRDLVAHMENLADLQEQLNNSFGDHDCTHSDFTDAFVTRVNDFRQPLNTLIKHCKDGVLQSSSYVNSDKSVVIDGAYFINFMNVAVELWYYENYYLNNLPKSVQIEHLVGVHDAKKIMKVYKDQISWIVQNSSYDPSFTKCFDTFGQTLTLDVNQGKKPLDKPVAK